MELFWSLLKQHLRPLGNCAPNFCGLVSSSRNHLITFFFSVGVHVMVQDVNEFAPEWTTVDSDDDEDDDDSDENDDDENPRPATLSVTVDEGQILEQVSS